MASKAMAMCLAALLSCAGCATGSANTKGPRLEGSKRKSPKLKRPAELFAILERSDRTYYSSTLDEYDGDLPFDFLDSLFPRRDAEHAFPWIEVDGEKRTLVEFRVIPEAADAVNEAEAHFQKGEYEQAAVCYRRAIDAQPDCYIAFMHMGDCFMFRQNPMKALQLYDEAIRINPWDFHPYLYKGNALAALGRFQDAKEAYIDALARMPRRDSVLKCAGQRAAEMGVEVRTKLFDPQVVIQEKKDGSIWFYAGDERGLGPVWLAYGACKAVWLGEPEHRKEMGCEHSIYSSLESIGEQGVFGGWAGHLHELEDGE
ncbi:MAG: tetratricopeptide repeat protein [Deltaproteobacteria bacterium]|nr:tetratricopeptide repeat protein [Deltaproteobacteria bacterium]